MPAVGQSLVNMHRRLYDATAELEAFHGQASQEVQAPPQQPMPFEEVRDFFYDRKNYIADLDLAAEQLFTRRRIQIGGLDSQLAALLSEELGIAVAVDDGEALGPNAKRLYRPDTRTLYVARWLHPGQRAFQLATQLALLTKADLISSILATDDQLSADARGVARIGLANYFAGALLLPYRTFLHAAESLRYDIDQLARRFEVGFETICHRLSTLQRPDARGVPFIFVRTDAAGNISKRQSATAFHFSRVGGNCPLWVVHHAFGRPGEFLTQVAEMPDGRSYFWIARTTSSTPSRYLGPHKSFAIGLGCDLAHADKLIYSAGIDLTDPDATVAIGAGCKICDRPACPQRAFPYVGRAVQRRPACQQRPAVPAECAERVGHRVSLAASWSIARVSVPDASCSRSSRIAVRLTKPTVSFIAPSGSAPAYSATRLAVKDVPPCWSDHAVMTWMACRVHSFFSSPIWSTPLLLLGDDASPRSKGSVWSGI